MEDDRNSIFLNFFRKFYDAPVTFVKEKIVEPNQKKPVYYHRRFPRVPTIDQCDIGDNLCRFEANEQYKRDKIVDKQILRMMNARRVECYQYYQDDKETMCTQVEKEYEETADNYFIKYGDLGINADVLDVYMKQKHRMIWERRQQEKGLMKDD